MKLSINILLLLLLSTLSVYAQQNPQFSQYLFNGVVINPAYAGSKGYLNLNALYRKQWAGLDNTPSSQTISADGPLINNASWGVFLSNDQIGYQRNSSLYGSFAYRVKVSKNGSLALGISAGVAQYFLEGEKLVTDIPNDPAVPDNQISVWTPDARVGIYYNTPRFFAGVSMWEVLSSNIVRNEMLADPEPHFYFSSGFALPISNSFTFRPSILLKEDFKAPSNSDITGFIIYKDRFWFGGSYRTRIFTKRDSEENFNLQARDAIALMIQVYPTEQLRLGYGYDITRTVFRKYGTHEISLGYFFLPKLKAGMLTPRYF